MKKTTYLFSLVILGLYLTTACKKDIVSCSNQIKDGNEIGVDCGGSCPVCGSEKDNTNAAPSSDLIGTWHYIRRTRTTKPLYANSAGIYLDIYSNSSQYNVELTDELNPDSSKKSYGSFATSSYPTEDYWRYDSLGYVNINTGSNSIGFIIKGQSSSSLFLNSGYYDYYYSKSESIYTGAPYQVQVELQILTYLPANALVADGDTLAAGQTLWAKTLTGSSAQNHFNIDIERPESSTATGSIQFKMLIRDSQGNILVSNSVGTLLEGYPPPPPPISDGPPQGSLSIGYDIKWH